VYFASYFKKVKGYDVNTLTFYPMYPALMLIACACFPLSAFLFKLFGNRSKPIILVASTILLTCMLLILFTDVSPFTFKVYFCIGVGMFRGLVGFALLRAGWSNMPNRRGLVSGVVISGIGMGGFIFG
jgi:hypothetical protein